MALLARFFKPKWQHENPDIRRQALTGLTQTDQLLSFIEREMLTELRLQAIQQLHAVDALEALLRHSNEEIREHARQVLLNRILPTDGNLQHINDDQRLLQIAVLTDDHDTRLAAIGEIRDEHARLQIAMNNPVAKVRLAAAEGIQTTTLLQQLLQHSQSKDKVLYRLCKTRLAHFKALQTAAIEQQQRFEQCITQLNYLIKVGYNPEFYGRLQILQQDWQQLKACIDTTVYADIEQPLALAQAILDEHTATEQARAEQRQRQQMAAEQQQQCLASITRWLDEPDQDEQGATLTQIHALATQWQLACQDHPASPECHHSFETGWQALQQMANARHQYQQQLTDIQAWLSSEPSTDSELLRQQEAQVQQWLSDLAWPQSQTLPCWLRDLQRHAERIAIQRQQIAGQDQQQTQRAEQRLRELEQALEQGQFKMAEKLHQQTNQALQALPHASANPLYSQFKLLTAQLYEMRDWQGYVTTPKQEALCQAMEALVGAELDPELIADKVQGLQEEWKQLGARADQATWLRFKSAADSAFEPCRSFFAERNALRQQWVAARQALTAQLNDYEQQLDWSNADWSAVQKTLDTARATFRQYSPVDRHAHQTTQAEFNAVCDRIYAHVKNDQDRHVLAKQQLIDQVTELLAQDDLSQAASQVKTLQQSWKLVGTIPRHIDQKLWRDFRHQCDAVFARLDEARQTRKNDIENEIASVQTRLEAAQTEISTAIADGLLSQADSVLQSLQRDLTAVRLPRAIQQQVRAYIDEWQQHIKQHYAEQEHAQARHRWQGLYDRLQALHQHDEALWRAAPALPDGYDRAAFEQAWQHRSARELNNEHARALCVQMEILSNLESPAEDASLRMSLQVQRLAEQLGNQRPADDERQHLVLNWLSVSANDALHQRFMTALQGSM